MTKTAHGRYSKVSRRMWVDEKFLRLSAPKPNARTLWQRLLTGPELGCIPGLFPARLAALAEDLEWPLPALKKCWGEIEREGMAEADWKRGLVWVPKAIEHNEPESPNVVRGWRVAWRELPDSELKDRARAALRSHLVAMGEPWAKAFDEATGKASPKPSAKALPHPSANQEQEQKQEQKDPPLPPRGRARDPFLASFSEPHPDEVWVFERWAEAFGKTGVVYDARRASCLTDRRSEDMTRQDALDALAGARRDDWVREAGFKLSVIFGDRERYEVFRDAGRAMRGSGSADPTRAAVEARVREQARRVGEALTPEEVDRRVAHELDPRTLRARAARDRMEAEERARQGGPDVAPVRGQAEAARAVLAGVVAAVGGGA